jgi:2-polyprenyl-6-methoxyphenol hydroxylase-like FAD-dependent oxidoreductase
VGTAERGELMPSGVPSTAASLPASTHVIVAGGGPVGLAAAIELGRRGISCLVIEPRTTVSQARPRCKTINVRSMEHLRRWGIAGRLRERAPLAPSWSQDVVFCTSLAGRELSRFTGVLGLVHDGDRFPELGQQAPQYVLEELLREVVRELPACTLATGVAVTGVEQDAAGVRVTVAGGAGQQAVVSGRYLLGCDGPRSTVRECIGAAYVGGQALRPNFGMVFRAPGLWQHVRHGPAVHYWIINPDAPALVGPLDQADTWWIIAFGVDRDTSDLEARRIIDAAAGTPTGAVVVSTDPWTARMQIADHMRQGRVFLAGDAAHLNPPFGGHGLNTGLGDAVDLGWKIAATLDGWAGPALLDSYEIERRPIQERVIREATANMQVTSPELVAGNLDQDDAAGAAARRAAGARIQATKRAEFHALELVLDVRVSPSPVIADDAPAAGPAAAGPAAGSPAAAGRGAPVAGALLPHAWLESGRSLYDELGDGFTLLTARSGAAPHAMTAAAGTAGVPLKVLEVDEQVLRGCAFVLVRPDNYVAWTGGGGPYEAAKVIDRVRGLQS